MDGRANGDVGPPTLCPRRGKFLRPRPMQRQLIAGMPVQAGEALDAMAPMGHPLAMDSDSLAIDWAAGEVTNGELRFPAIFDGDSGWVILLESEMQAASEEADDGVLVAFGGLVGWIVDAANKAFARSAMVRAEESFQMLIMRKDFSLTAQPRAIN